MNQAARGYLAYARAKKRQVGLEEEASQPARRAPIHSKGILFSEEGIETHAVAAEQLGTPFSLPASEVAFEVRPARYRLELRLAEPGAIDVLRDGQKIVSSRRAAGTAVLDIEGGSFTVASSSLISGARLHRFEQRSEGEIILGPFRAQGTVEATAKGHGTWTAEVASNYVRKGSLGAGGKLPSLTLEDDVWEGAVPGQSLPESRLSPIEQGTPWSVARRFESGLEAPRWADAVKAASTRSGHEEVSESGVIDLDHDTYEYWRGVGEWALLAGSEAPAFDPAPGRWTYVWGTASGVGRAYSLQTGRRADPTAKGIYLAKSSAPSEVEIEGAHAAYGSPVSADRETLAPGGAVWRAKKSEHPPQVLVRLQGKGLARAIEITETRKRGPKGKEFTQSRRIDLSKYWDPRQTNVSAPQRPEGRGLFLPHPNESPSQ